MRVRRRNHKEAKRRIIDMSLIWQQCHNFYKLFKKESIISSYDLNSNDNPGKHNHPCPRSGWNYDEWTKAVWTSLQARRKWGFVEGIIKKPKEESLTCQWFGSNVTIFINYLKNNPKFLRMIWIFEWQPMQHNHPCPTLG
jgi:hypothetical protein